MWARLVISGTTRRYLACRSICVATTLLRTCHPSEMTAAAVSSQVDSIARISDMGDCSRHTPGATASRHTERACNLYDLNHLHVDDQPRIKVDSLLEDSSK